MKQQARAVLTSGKPCANSHFYPSLLKSWNAEKLLRYLNAPRYAIFLKNPSPHTYSCVFSLPPPQFPLHHPSCAGKTASSRHTSYSPMFSVTVMMFRDMVESVMLLKDDDCNVKKTRDVTWCLGTIPKPNSIHLYSFHPPTAAQSQPTTPASC